MKQAPSSAHSFDSLLISLYLILLSFFILLNSVSQIQLNRVEGTIQSLRKQFDQKNLHDDIHAMTMVAPDGRHLAPETFLQRMGQFAMKELQLSNVDVIETGTTITFKVPVQVFYRKDSVYVRAFVEPFLLRLADEILLASRDHPMNLEVVFGVPEISSSHTAENNLTLARIGGLGRQLIISGIPKERVYLGIAENVDTSRITISISYATEMHETKPTEATP